MEISKIEALLGCGVWRYFEGEKGERAKKYDSPDLSTQPIVLVLFFCPPLL